MSTIVLTRATHDASFATPHKLVERASDQSATSAGYGTRIMPQHDFVEDADVRFERRLSMDEDLNAGVSSGEELEPDIRFERKLSPSAEARAARNRRDNARRAPQHDLVEDADVRFEKQVSFEEELNDDDDDDVFLFEPIKRQITPENLDADTRFERQLTPPAEAENPPCASQNKLPNSLKQAPGVVVHRRDLSAMRRSRFMSGACTTSTQADSTADDASTKSVTVGEIPVTKCAPKKCADKYMTWPSAAEQVTEQATTSETARQSVTRIKKALQLGSQLPSPLAEEDLNLSTPMAGGHTGADGFCN